MKFSTCLFALSAIAGAVSADSSTQDIAASASRTSNSGLSSRSTVRTASWNLYNRASRPHEVRTVSLGETRGQSGVSDSITAHTISNSKLPTRSNTRSSSWRVFKRTSRPLVAKIISLEDVQRQSEGGIGLERSGGVESRSADTSVPEEGSIGLASTVGVKPRSVDTPASEDVSSHETRSGLENSGDVGSPVSIPRRQNEVRDTRRRSTGKGAFAARRLERV